MLPTTCTAVVRMAVASFAFALAAGALAPPSMAAASAGEGSSMERSRSSHMRSHHTSRRTVRRYGSRSTSRSDGDGGSRGCGQYMYHDSKTGSCMDARNKANTKF